MNLKHITTLCSPLLMIPQAFGSEKPNILFIYVDDICYESFYNNPNDSFDIETPNIDRLIHNGTYFTQAHNQGAWSAGVSVASRTMMVTGEYIWRAAQKSSKSKIKVGGNNNPRTMPDYTVKTSPLPTLWPTLIKEAGYETYMAGKWHVDKVNPKLLFDHTGTVRSGMPPQHIDCYNRKFDGITPDKWTPYDKSYGGFWSGGKHWSEVLRDETIDFLNHSEGQEKPFFMYIAFNASHDPRQSPKEYIDKYPVDKIGVPENFLPEYPYDDEIGAGSYLRDEKLAPFPRNELSVKTNRQEYYALITHLDHQIGKILDTLEATGQADNTYIFFTADHGIAIGEHGFMGKQNMYENSMRVPLIAYGPGIQKNKIIDKYVYLQDIMPTTLELAEVPTPENVDFHSLMPLATGKSKRSSYDYLYGAYMGVQRMVKGDNYKMIIYPNINLVRLYNLKRDPLEMNDLANDPKQKPRMIKLFGELQRLQAQVEDPLDVTPYFNTFINEL